MPPISESRPVDTQTLVDALLSATESPIEDSFLRLLAWHMVLEAGSRFVAITRSPFDWSSPGNLKLASKPPVPPSPFDGLQVRGIGFSAQVRIDRYRADFAIQKLYVKRGEFSIGRTLLVECDGHAYHNSEPWQIARDEQRDKWIMEQRDCSILRLKGHEIHSNPTGCAARALDLLDSLSGYGVENQRFLGLEDTDNAETDQED